MSVEHSLADLVDALSDIHPIVKACKETCTAIYIIAKEYRNRLDDYGRFTAIVEDQAITWENFLDIIDLMEESEEGPDEKNRTYLRENLSGMQTDLERLKDKMEEWKTKLYSGKRIVGTISGTRFVFGGKSSLETLAGKVEEWKARVSDHILRLNYIIQFRLWKGSSKSEQEKVPEVFQFLERINEAKRRAEAKEVDYIDESEINILSYTNLDPDDLDSKYGVKVQKVKGVPKYNGCLVDHRPYYSNDRGLQAMTDDTIRLAALLWGNQTPDARKVDEEVGGLLRCCGIIKRCNPINRFELVFKLPPSTDPNVFSLRKALADPRGPQHSLNDRLHLALKLSQALNLVHSAGLIHKNVRPESVLITESYQVSAEDKYPKKLGTPYLCAFGQARSQGGYTERYSHSNEPLRQLAYRPPRHQGNDRIDEYRMTDDIYSLGICLLEIGLWKSLFKYEKGRYGEDKSVFDFGSDKKPIQIKEEFVQKAKTEIPRTMGVLFSEVVVDCLECLDPNSRFGSVDTDAAMIGVSYSELVLGKLRTITL